MANLTSGRAQPIRLRVLELKRTVGTAYRPTGRVVTVDVLSFERVTDGRTGDAWRVPILPATRLSETQVEVRCPFCGRQHLHGVGAGHRVAECGLGVGYVVREVAP